MRKQFLVALGLFASAVFFGSTFDALARGKFRIGTGVRIGANAIKHYSADIMTVSELKSCLADEQNIDKTDSILSQYKSRIESGKLEIDLLEREISIKRLTINRSSQSDIDLFNRMVENYNKRVEFVKRQIDDFNSKVGASRGELENYNARCAGKRYYEDDLLTARQSLNIQY